MKQLVLALTALLLTGCLDETERFLAATNDCKRDMQYCRNCRPASLDNLPNYEAVKFYALCMDKQGYSMGLAEAQTCLNAPSLNCYGVGNKASGLWNRYTSRLSESFDHIRKQ